MPKIKIILSSFIAIVGVLIASVAPAGASSWSGMLHVYDKTHGDMLMQDGDTFYARHHTNVVFAPEGMGPNAHHFTIIAKDQETGKMVWGSYRTMVSRWSMEHPTQDRHLGYRFKKGTYWIQIDAYQADGAGAGNYYSKLVVE